MCHGAFGIDFWHREEVDFKEDGLKSQKAILLEGRIAAYSSAA